MTTKNFTMALQLILATLVLIAPGFSQQPANATNSLKLNPEIAAPGEFVNFSFTT